MARGIVAFLLCAASGIAASPTSQTSTADVPTGHKLVEVITELDAKISAAYSTCDLNAMASLLAPDVELYNDETGRIVGRDSVIDTLRKNLCGGLRSAVVKYRRELVAGSLEVFPIARFGALEFSKSEIWADQSDGTSKPVVIVRALTVWELRAGVWMAARQFAYSHEPVSRRDE